MVRFCLPLRLLSLVVGYCSFLSTHEHSLSDPTQTTRRPSYLPIIQGNIDPSISNEIQIVETHHYLSHSFDRCRSDTLDQSCAVIDVLFLSVVIIAEQIAAAYHKDQIILDEQLESVFELETEEFIVIQQIEAA